MAVTQAAGPVIRMTATNDAITNTVFVCGIRWINPTIGHTLQITDTAGNIYATWVHTATSPGSACIPVEQVMIGIKAASLPSGTLEINTKILAR